MYIARALLISLLSTVCAIADKGDPQSAGKYTCLVSLRAASWIINPLKWLNPLKSNIKPIGAKDD